MKNKKYMLIVENTVRIKIYFKKSTLKKSRHSEITTIIPTY